MAAKDCDEKRKREKELACSKKHVILVKGKKERQRHNKRLKKGEKRTKTGILTRPFIPRKIDTKRTMPLPNNANSIILVDSKHFLN